MDEIAVGGAAMRAIPSRKAGPITVRGHFGDQLHGAVASSANLVRQLHASPFDLGLWGFSQRLTMTGGLPFGELEQNNFRRGGEPECRTEKRDGLHESLVVRRGEEVGEYECADYGGAQENDVAVTFHTIGTPPRGRVAQSFP